MSIADKTGIYIHIPFCRRKCDYCSFFSMPVSAESVLIEKYVQRIQREILSLPDGWYDAKADTVYFGGGTPSILTPGNAAEIISTLKRRFDIPGDAEITIEMNPEDLTDSKIRGFGDAGINRIVLGVQSLDEAARSVIGRRGDYNIKEKLDQFFLYNGFTKCVDIIAGIPGQDASRCIEDLGVVTGYAPEHISMYLLSIEGGTPLDSRLSPDDAFDEFQAGVWGEAIDFLAAKGYSHYEISNFCLPGFESVHNSKYWHFIPYAGFGTGAHSFTGDKRYSNNMTVEEYINSADVIYSYDKRDESDVVVEFFMTSLRDLRGFSDAGFRCVTGKDMPQDLRSKLSSLCDRGLLKLTNNLYFLTREGLFCANRVIYELTEDYIR